jgi:tetratricopeptide (TPR) repeat protein
MNQSSSNKLPSLQRLPLEKVPHAIDFIGTGTFQVSQYDVLQKRSIEVMKTTESNLSARGLHHRSKDYFMKDVRASTAVIQQALLQGVRDPKNQNKSNVYLKSQYFQRALGYERLGNIDGAIDDYTRCINLDEQCAVAYFNRGGLYYSQNKLDLATFDYDKAIEIEPSKQIYHTNRALIYRRRGLFTEATSDTLISKNISKSRIRNDVTAVRSELKKQISIFTNDEDPVVTFLKKPFLEREESGDLRIVIEFLKSVKFFHGISTEPLVMKNCAKKVRLIKYDKDHVIFNEGDLGTSFFVILDGEVSIVKVMRLLDSEKTKTEILVKLYRAQTFGETALDHEHGVRSAGAIASQTTHLLVMDVVDYKRIFAHYRMQLRNDIR